MGERGLATSDLIWSEHALTVTSTAASDDELEVRVWSVLVIAARGGSVPRQVWRTSTLTLRWTDGGWRVDAWSTDPGPTPAPPTEVDPASIDDIDDVTSWPSAPRGGGS